MTPTRIRGRQARCARLLAIGAFAASIVARDAEAQEGPAESVGDSPSEQETGEGAGNGEDGGAPGATGEDDGTPEAIGEDDGAPEATGEDDGAPDKEEAGGNVVEGDTVPEDVARDDSVAEAQPIVIEFTDTLVTGTRTKRRRANTAHAVSVVNRGELRRERPVAVGEAIAQAPGVHVVDRGPLFSNPSIRGLSGRRVVMLVDGLRVHSAKTMGVTGHSIEMDDVARIEIVRGPTSVMWGTDALGGTVNVLTVDGFKHRGVRSRYGVLVGTNNSELTNSLSLRYGEDHFFVKASGRWRDAGNYTAGDGQVVDTTFYHDRSANAEAGLRFGRHTLRFGTQNYFGGDIGKATSPDDLDLHRKIYFPREDNHRAVLRYDMEEAGRVERVHVSVVGDWVEREQSIDQYTVDWARQIAATQKIGSYFFVDGQAYTTLRLAAGNDLTVGMSGIRNAYDSSKVGYGILPDGTHTEPTTTTEFDNARSLALGAFAQDEWRIVQPLWLTFGARYDTLEVWATPHDEVIEDHSHDQAISSNLSLLYKPVRDLAIFTNAGRAFRGATIREKYFYGTTCFGLYCGNPDLVPETSWNLDAGVRSTRGPLSVEGYLFGSLVRNLITANPAPEESECDAIYENTTRARLVGAELELSAKLTNLIGDGFVFRPFARFSHVHAEDLDSHDPIPEIPPARLTGGLRAFGNNANDEHQYYVEVRASANFAQNRVAEGELKTPSFVLVDVLAGLELPPFMFFRFARLNLKATNLLDADYRHHLAVASGMGRNVRIGLDLAF